MTLAAEAETRAAKYREIAYELWRLAIDQRRDVSFETRRELATIAEDFEQLAASCDPAWKIDPDRGVIGVQV